MEHFLSLLQETARRQWDLPALSDFHGSSYTHKEVYHKVMTLKKAYELLGIREGDRVAIVGKSSSSWALAFLSAVSSKAVAVPLLFGFTPDVLTHLLDHSGSRVLFTEKRIFDALDLDALACMEAVFLLDDLSILYIRNKELEPKVRRAEGLVTDAYPGGIRPQDAVYEGRGLDELCVINYTSGTTGTPKGVMLSARALSANVDYCRKNIPVHAGDTTLSVLPMAHMYGLSVEFLFTFCMGSHVVFLCRQPSPNVLYLAYQEVRPFMVILVPMIVEKVFQSWVFPYLRKPRYYLMYKLPVVRAFFHVLLRRKFLMFLGGKMRIMTIGGAALMPQVEEMLYRGRVPFSVGYGMTECAPLIGYASPGKFKRGSCGRSVDGMEVRVDSPDPMRIPGELQMRGDHVMMGYYRNEQATREAFTQDGWLRSGDLGVMDRRGNIYIRGRIKCMILSSSGQNIYPEEMEEKINFMDEVQESLVVERQGHLVALVHPSEAAMKDRNDLDGLSVSILRKANNLMPSYAKLSRVEILEKGFVHTPKHSIKRSLYS